jgi:hypothetical protein
MCCRQRVQRLRHVRVAQVPRIWPSDEHRAIVLLGVQHETCVLLGKDVVIGRNVSVALRVLGGAALQIHQLRDDLAFARSAHVERRGVAIRLSRFAVIFEA